MCLDHRGRLRGTAATRRTVAHYCAALLVGLLSLGTAAQDELETVGMAVHTETARDIYIAGLLLPYGAVMQNLMLAPPPKGMEYRIATRRISSRGFSGTILLQAELGSGGRAPEAAINALAALKESMKSSLKQGDQFIIYLNESDETVFMVNGTELLRVADGAVFDFFFSGWVGEGAATTFREPLLAGTLDPGVAERFNQLSPSEARIADVAAWNSESTEPAAPAAAPVQVAKAPQPAAPPTPTPGPVSEPVAQSEPEPEAEPEPEPQQVAVAEPAPEPVPVPEPAPEPAQNPQPQPDPAPKPAPKQEPVQVAAAAPTSETAALDDREYQRELQIYISEVMRQVYGEVKYPRRAIKYNWEGKVELLARMGADGELIEVTIDSTSGHVGLDKAAQAAVERAAPFPELSAVAREELASDDGNSYIMAIPVTFALRR